MFARGPKKHLKRLHAPKSWMLDKLGGVFVSMFTVEIYYTFRIKYVNFLVILISDVLYDLLGNLCMVTGGHNLGRVGIVTSRERHPGSFDIVHVKDAQGHTFATRLNYIFAIGKGNKPYISLPRGKGVRLTVAEERDRRLHAKREH
ncbi:40S ribosomal protein S4-like [Limulus polyphemus]|uniref:40S ribosomal protein S4 n=1 Tax=Limulus polyphemus TaxID=6850 RepID=A0ABM1C244_LIMPO|nr:40S ribosomal protein S4-like [Limulus polyphemus]